MAADHSFTLIAGEEMGRISCGGVPMAMAVQMSMATPGPGALRVRPSSRSSYLAPSIRGELVASMAVTEPDAGSDVAGIRTRAVRDGDEWVINGSKLYITNGTQADWLCLLARTSEEGGYRGMSLIVVPTASDGVVVSRKLEKLGMWSSDTAELSFHDVRVPVTNTIGEIGRGFQQQMVQFQAERLITVYKQVGAIEQALRADPRLPARASGLRAARSWPTSICSSCWPSSGPVTTCSSTTPAPRPTPSRGARTPPASPPSASCMGSRLQREVADAAVQFHGGIAYMAEHWASRFYRDTRLDSIGAGADEVMLRILARTDGFAKEERSGVPEDRLPSPTGQELATGGPDPPRP